MEIEKTREFFDKEIDTYLEYMDLTNQKERTARHILNHLTNLLKSKYIDILLVGGGTGRPELEIISGLIDMGYRPNITYLDPSSRMADVFRSRASGLNPEIHVTRFEEFETDKRFDVILLINSIYFIEGWKEIGDDNPLFKVYSLLKENGVGVFVLKSEESKHTVIKRLVGGRSTGRLLVSVLHSLGLPVYWDKIYAEIDTSPCFNENGFIETERCRRLMNFLLKNKWDEMGKEDKRKAVGILVELVDERKVLETTYDCVWMRKQGMGEPRVVDGPEELKKELYKEINVVKDFPKEGILFVDTTPVLRNPDLFSRVIRYAAEYYRGRVDYIVAKDMQALIWAGALARELGVGIVPMFRKDLAGDVVSSVYSHEYNPDRVINLQKHALKPGDRVLLVDYIIATGETMRRMAHLVEHLGAKVEGIFVPIELTHLGGRIGLEGYELHSILKLGRDDLFRKAQ